MTTGHVILIDSLVNEFDHKWMYKGDNTGYIVQQDKTKYKVYKNDTVTKHLDCIYNTDKLSVFASCCVHGHKIIIILTL